jgi:hypothetical protein
MMNQNMQGGMGGMQQPYGGQQEQGNTQNQMGQQHPQMGQMAQPQMGQQSVQGSPGGEAPLSPKGNPFDMY